MDGSECSEIISETNAMTLEISSRNMYLRSIHFKHVVNKGIRNVSREDAYTLLLFKKN